MTDGLVGDGTGRAAADHNVAFYARDMENQKGFFDRYNLAVRDIITIDPLA